MKRFRNLPIRVELPAMLPEYIGFVAADVLWLDTRYVVNAELRHATFFRSEQAQLTLRVTAEVNARVERRLWAWNAQGKLMLDDIPIHAFGEKAQIEHEYAGPQDPRTESREKTRRVRRDEGDRRAGRTRVSGARARRVQGAVSCRENGWSCPGCSTCQTRPSRRLEPVAPEELDRMQRAAEQGVHFPPHEALRLIHTIRSLRLAAPEEPTDPTRSS